MLRKILFTVLTISQFGLYSQTGLNIRLPEMYSSQAAAIYADDNYAYVMGSTFDTTRIAVLIGKLYKIDIENQEVVDVITINENPIEFIPYANMLLERDGKLHYLASGFEWRDTIINNQNVYSHYHHFEYNLEGAEWQNSTFPAFNDWGRQFINHWDAFLTSESIYAANSTHDYNYNDVDILITKMDYEGNVLWNNKHPNELGHTLRGIIVDADGNVVLTGVQFYSTIRKDEGFKHLYVYKINPNDGSIIAQYLSDEILTSPRAVIEDPQGG